MYEENISLVDAMTKGANHMVCSWRISGLHVKVDDLPSGANVHMTTITKCDDDFYSLYVHWTKEGDLKTYIGTIAEFSTLEEMKKEYPNLFELKGILYAFP